MLRRLRRDLGWRIVAIPVLAVITIWVFVDIIVTGHVGIPGRSRQATTSAAPVPVVGSPVQPDLGPGPDPSRAIPPVIPGGKLPAGGPFSSVGTKTYRTVGHPGASAGADHSTVFTYTVEVENGVSTADFGGDDAFSALVDATLSDPRGWTHDSRFGFRHIGPDSGQPMLRIQLTSPATTHIVCGDSLKIETSCYDPDGHRVVVNVARWVRGAAPFDGDLGSYRQYVINHEVGHAIGFRKHQPCGKNGALAPVMMQQTLSLNNSELHALQPEEVYSDDHAVCRYNPWPYPAP